MSFLSFFFFNSLTHLVQFTEFSVSRGQRGDMPDEKILDKKGEVTEKMYWAGG